MTTSVLVANPTRSVAGTHAVHLISEVTDEAPPVTPLALVQRSIALATIHFTYLHLAPVGDVEYAAMRTDSAR